MVFAFGLLCPLAYSATSLSSQTANNTAACAAAGSPSYCHAKWVGLSDSTSGTYDPAPGRISTVDIHSLIPGGSATKVLAHFQPWFCMNSGSTSTGVGTSCGGHLQVGYNSNDSYTVNGQLNDMRRRGFNGVVVDWYGPTLNNYDQVSQKMKSNLVSRCSGPQACPLYLALMEDQGAFIWTKCHINGGGVSVAQQTTCITNALESDLDYMNSNYFGTNAYLKVNGSMQISAAGKPVVSFSFVRRVSQIPHRTGAPSGAAWTAMLPDIPAARRCLYLRVAAGLPTLRLMAPSPGLTGMAPATLTASSTWIISTIPL